MKVIRFILACAIVPSASISHAQGSSDMLRAAKTQSYDGREYYAIDAFDLQNNLKKSCESQADTSLVGKRVSAVVAARKPSFFTVDGSSFQGFWIPDPINHPSLYGYFFWGNVNRVQGLLNSKAAFFKNCESSVFEWCLVAVYGTVRYVEPKNVSYGFASWDMGRKECILDIDGVKTLGVQDRTKDAVRGGIEGGIAGFRAGVKIFK